MSPTTRPFAIDRVARGSKKASRGHKSAAFAADGYDLVLAGHTHGGQLRLPIYGAIVTNCGIDRSRARGASRWGSHMRLNVSAGLGTSPFAPARFCCPPEASLLTLVARPADPQAAADTRAKTSADVG